MLFAQMINSLDRCHGDPAPPDFLMYLRISFSSHITVHIHSNILQNNCPVKFKSHQSLCPTPHIVLFHFMRPTITLTSYSGEIDINIWEMVELKMSFLYLELLLLVCSVQHFLSRTFLCNPNRLLP